MNTSPDPWPAAPAAPSPAPDEIHAWCVPLDLPQAEVEHLWSMLSDDERQRASALRFERLRCRFVVAHARLRAILARYLGASAGQLVFKYHARGKPALVAAWDKNDLRFNLSHSEGLALVAVAFGCEVGVDLEWIRPIANMAQLVERHFSAEEKCQWRRLPAEEQLVAFFHGWTRKEAWLKAMGVGLSFPLDQVCVSLAPDEPVRLTSVQGNHGEAAKWTLEDIPPAPGHAGALAVRGSPSRICRWSWSDGLVASH